MEFTIFDRQTDRQTDRQNSKTFYWMRTIALLAVVMTHAHFQATDVRILNHLVGSFCRSGVAIFFFTAGVYWKWSPPLSTLKHFAVKLLPPWILFGSLLYAISTLKDGFSLTSWFFWLVGKNTYLWYLTIYVVIQIMFSILRIEGKHSLMMCILITVVSRTMTAYLGISGYRAFLNPLNWVGFFASGVAYSYYGYRRKKQTKKTIGFLQFAAIVVIIFTVYFDTRIFNTNSGYFTYSDCFSQFAWIVVLLFVCSNLAELHGYEIGKASLPIYLMHISVIGFVTSRFAVGVPLAILLSIVIICALYMCLFIGWKVAATLKLDKLFSTVTGFTPYG